MSNHHQIQRDRRKLYAIRSKRVRRRIDNHTSPDADTSFGKVRKRWAIDEIERADVREQLAEMGIHHA